MITYNNPFEPSSDRHMLWEMLVERDIKAFIQQDWAMVANDFVPEQFYGISAHGKDNPDSWTLVFPDLESYKAEWLSQANLFARGDYVDNLESAIYEATNLRDIEIQGNKALLHKKFDGQVIHTNGKVNILNWQTLYFCQKHAGEWKIIGFAGYMPFPMGRHNQPKKVLKSVPKGASQHLTAGPYSPVLEVDPHKIVVTSGQAAINAVGEVIGDTIEEQTELTLDNCVKQLRDAGCNLSDVFKVNIYLRDLDDWPQMNEVYMRRIPEPRPVRTAVGTALLMTMLVEIEMWAVKR